MPRGRKKQTEPATKSAQDLIDALKFVSLAQKDKGSVGETHCILWGKFVAAFDGVLSAGHPIDDDLRACPQTKGFAAALERCSAQYAITQLEGALAIKSEKFRAVVPCVEADLLPIPNLDNGSIVPTEGFMVGLKVLNDIIVEKGERVIECSLLLRNGSMVAGEGHILVEYWHGMQVGADVILPKACIAALLKCAYPIKTIGIGDHSITFYFENGAWLRSQTYSEGWPVGSLDRVLNAQTSPQTVPAMLFNALDIVEKFSEDGKIRLWADCVSSHDSKDVGATYEIDLPYSVTLNYKYLKFIEPFTKMIDFKGPNDSVYFYGDKIRGALISYVKG